MRTSQAVKYSLFVSCYIFWVASGLMIAAGLYAKLCKETGVVDSLTADPAILLIVVGTLMFAINFLGCMGALRDLDLMLKIFASMLVLVMILQFVAAVLGFMFSGRVIEKATAVMSRAIIHYREDLDLQNFIDYIQKKFECCGVDNYKDWSLNVYFSCKDTNPSQEKCGVPYSCCVKEEKLSVINTMCGYNTQNLRSWYAETNIYVDGCLNSIVSWGRGNLLFLGCIATGLIFLEILGTSLAVVLIYQINAINERTQTTAEMRTNIQMEGEDEFIIHTAEMQSEYLEQHYTYYTSSMN
ncbi:tetraspanin-33-like isoform X1 [Mixophyes fleayi]|uniref:tetraspanin-33-like isoform X1 n=1 Tax=Mixophyes fleayi TaxID=3061075 RepID=UPI003F4DC370